ncbi:MAG: hypothetical protein KFF50_14070, partial [Desulfatitalea sp.]|nr:hypothetical protein [Desulfatitalea sp.]
MRLDDRFGCGQGKSSNRRNAGHPNQTRTIKSGRIFVKERKAGKEGGCTSCHAKKGGGSTAQR